MQQTRATAGEVGGEPKLKGRGVARGRTGAYFRCFKEAPEGDVMRCLD